MSKLPKISVITVVYNGVSLLEGTIESVIHQTYQNVEYIIVDGASKDGTIDVIKKYEPQITQWISEPDKGLYDAMNKGLALATGDFVWFMNAGDRIFAKNTLENIIQHYHSECDILYGEVQLVNDERKHLGTRSELTTQKLPKVLHSHSLRRGMVVCHQGFLPRKNIAPKYRLDNLAADIEWVIACLRKSRATVNTGEILAEYLQGGVSKQRHQQSLKDRYQILKEQYGFFPNLWNHFWILMRGLWFKIERLGKEQY